MSDFHISSQKNHWIFSREDIDAEKLHLMQERYNKPISQEIPNLLKLEELTIQYFCRQILIIFNLIRPRQKVTLLRRKWRVPSTAVVYFRRFYVFNSLMDYDPRLIMLCSIFLAGKSEENFIKVDELKAINQKVSDTDILEGEKVLLDGLKFDLKVFHPHNIKDSLIADWKSWTITKLQISDQQEQRKQLSEQCTHWAAEAHELLDLLQTTLAVMLYRPLALATYSLLATLPAALPTDFRDYIREKFGEAEWSILGPELITLRQYGEPLQEPNFDAVKPYFDNLLKTNRWNLASATSSSEFVDGSSVMDV